MIKTQGELNAALDASPSQFRITPEYIDSRIADVVCHRLGGGTLTVCVITLDNGFKVTGNSACADPANYRADAGEKIAYNNAFRELWPLFGFLLVEGMHNQRKAAHKSEVEL